jgi:transcriptional regulator with XRE-family HTH domain
MINLAAPRRRAVEGRNGEVWHRYAVRGQTQARIAEDLGISQTRVSQILDKIFEDPALQPDKKKILAASLELIGYVKDQALEIVEMAGAPVFVGKDGQVAIDPDDGSVVRDYSGRLNALKMALAADDTIAKRLGLDSAVKVEQSGGYRIEVVGVNMDDLS